MRPRGESSSSPSSRYVGQVAVQKPQWTQVRRIFSDDCIAGSRSCSGAKLVCIFIYLSKHVIPGERSETRDLWPQKAPFRHGVVVSPPSAPPEDDGIVATP